MRKSVLQLLDILRQFRVLRLFCWRTVLSLDVEDCISLHEQILEVLLILSSILSCSVSRLLCLVLCWCFLRWGRDVCSWRRRDTNSRLLTWLLCCLLVGQHVGVVDVTYESLHGNGPRNVIVVAPVGEPCGLVWRTDSVEVVVATVGRLAGMHEDAHQVILLATEVEVRLGRNWLVDLDADKLLTLVDNLKALVVNEEDL